MYDDHSLPNCLLQQNANTEKTKLTAFISPYSSQHLKHARLKVVPV